MSGEKKIKNEHCVDEAVAIFTNSVKRLVDIKGSEILKNKDSGSYLGTVASDRMATEFAKIQFQHCVENSPPLETGAPSADKPVLGR